MQSVFYHCLSTRLRFSTGRRRLSTSTTELFMVDVRLNFHHARIFCFPIIYKFSQFTILNFNLFLFWMKISFVWIILASFFLYLFVLFVSYKICFFFSLSVSLYLYLPESIVTLQPVLRTVERQAKLTIYVNPYYCTNMFGKYKVCLMGHTWYIHLNTIGRPFIHTHVSLLIRLSMPLQYQFKVGFYYFCVGRSNKICLILYPFIPYWSSTSQTG